MNPFKYGCIVGGANFCPRPELAKSIQEFVESGQNFYIQGERRMGKSSLVCDTLSRLKSVRLLYVDLLHIRSVGDFCHRVVRAASRLDRRRSFLDTVMALVRRLRPTLSVDVETGAPVVSVDFATASTSESVEDILDMIAQLSKRMKLCVVFDEFQDILHVEDPQTVLALLRSGIQFQSEVPFVFLGSVRNAMSDTFTKSRSPFYKSAMSIHVGEIEEEVFARFLEMKFRKGGRVVDRAIVRSIMACARNTPGDVQELCETVWQCTSPDRHVDIGDIDKALALIFSREAKEYDFVLKQLTRIQLRILVGLARRDVSKPCAGEFLKETGVANVNTVRKAIHKLMELDVVYLHDGVYRFSNPFFREWVRRRI